MQIVIAKGCLFLEMSLKLYLLVVIVVISTCLVEVNSRGRGSYKKYLAAKKVRKDTQAAIDAEKSKAEKEKGSGETQGKPDATDVKPAAPPGPHPYGPLPPGPYRHGPWARRPYPFRPAGYRHPYPMYDYYEY